MNKEKRLTIALVLALVMVLVLSIQFVDQNGRLEELEESEREFNLALREQVQTEVHVMTWSQFYKVKERIDICDRDIQQLNEEFGWSLERAERFYNQIWDLNDWMSCERWSTRCLEAGVE